MSSSGTATDFDDDGFHATLLDLHEKGKIKVEVEDKDVVINIINDKGLDRYEHQVMDFLQKLAKNNVIRTEYMKQMVDQAQSNTLIESKVVALKEQYGRLVAGTENEVADEFTVNGRKKLIPLLLLSLLLTFGPLFSLIFYDNATMIFLSAAGYGAIVLVQFIVAVIFPTTLFGYWKDDNYREKLEWDAFKNHLSDFSRLEQYGPEDMNMWGSWLVYGTALGVGELVADAMQSLKIDYPSMHLVQTYPYWFMPISTAGTPSMEKQRERRWRRWRWLRWWRRVWWRWRRRPLNVIFRYIFFNCLQGVEELSTPPRNRILRVPTILILLK